MAVGETIAANRGEMRRANDAFRQVSLLLLAVLGAVIGILAWVFYGWALRGDPGQDWMVFYTAARAWFDGNLPLVFDGERLTAALNDRFADWLSFRLNLHPWVYPPTFLLLFLPFGALPPLPSLVAFLGLTFAAVILAAWLYDVRPRTRCTLLFSLLLCPAVPFNVMTGQNAFFTAALFIGGFGMLPRRPMIGGLLLGLLTIKPQFCLMVPIALLAARQWRAMTGAAASALILALLSIGIFGIEPWRIWLELVTGATESYRAWATAGRLNGLSVFACASLLGAPAALANFVQLIAIAISAGFVWFAYRRRTAPESLQLAILLAATMLAAPHASASDAVLLALAAGSVISTAFAHRLGAAPVAVAAAVWICPLVNPPSLFRAGLITPVLLLLFLVCVTVLPLQRRITETRPL